MPKWMHDLWRDLRALLSGLPRPDNVWADLSAPGGANQKPGDRLSTAVAHAALGACGATLLDWPMLVFVPLVYGVVKEWLLDMRRGGTARDGIIDTFFVLVGCFYAGPFFWPWMVLAFAWLDGAYGRHLRLLGKPSQSDQNGE